MRTRHAPNRYDTEYPGERTVVTVTKKKRKVDLKQKLLTIYDANKHNELLLGVLKASGWEHKEDRYLNYGTTVRGGDKEIKKFNLPTDGFTILRNKKFPYNRYPGDFVRAHLHCKDPNNEEMVNQSMDSFWQCLFNEDELEDKLNYTGRWIATLGENFQDDLLKEEVCLFLNVIFSVHFIIYSFLYNLFV